jgi:hypothetical protein
MNQQTNKKIIIQKKKNLFVSRMLSAHKQTKINLLSIIVLLFNKLYNYK